MRRRLYLTYLPLLAAALIALAVPLAIGTAARDSQDMYIDRAGDTARFASLAETALRTGHTSALHYELEQYDALFGIPAAVVDRDGTVAISSRTNLDLGSGQVQERVKEALSGEASRSSPTVWPWRTGPMVVVEPVGSSGEVIGVAVTVSPTGRLRQGLVDAWTRLLAGMLLVVLVGVVVVALVARWVLRPVAELDLAAHALSEGRFDERVASRAGPSELRSLAESFNAMAGQIAVLLERQRSFVSYASHQMRTPLAALRLWLENLEPEVGPDGRSDHAMALEEVDRMAHLYDALLAYASAEASAVKAVDVDLVALARARADGWRDVAARRGVELTGPDAGELPAHADPAALEQALDAIIDNAVKFSGEGGRVRIGAEPVPSDGAAVVVTDTGPGMTEDESRDALQPFWRRPADQNIEGSGLGLTIAHALVTASGGRLELTAADPSGLRVRIVLPVPAEEPDR
ncbi:sensor histidine kinase [Actinomadura rupiterrae]|uniref:sensor histidine kinase n=1 Tax=Actinomadura rupiterrae TaxID=559627 RepID=UPI0020A468E7|nr:HAMP domain-containing sensor histidine kinase [Actinomadura rupiterrae]MCP2335976.1 signal transduction histidine kinase [Actinomadura rupiterrae]